MVAGPFTGFGGSGTGGGGGTSNNVLLTLTNATGWVSSTIASGASCVLSIEWSSIEDGLATGKLLCVTSPVTVFLIVLTLLVTIILHIKNCLDLSSNLYENPFPEVKV